MVFLALYSFSATVAKTVTMCALVREYRTDIMHA